MEGTLFGLLRSLKGITVTVIDRDGRFEVLTPASLEQLALDEAPADQAEMLRKRTLYGEDGVTPLTLAELAGSRALAGEVVEDMLMSVRDPDGAIRYQRVSAAPHYGKADGGRIEGAVIIVRDVTEEHALAVREADLRRRLIDVINHQFRTPLAIIDSTVQRIMRRRDRMDNDELLARAGAIRAAASSLTQLMDSTLSAARLDAGELALSIHPIPLASLLAQVRAKLLVLEPHREITLDIADLPDIPCDALLIEQVLGNLIGNALKYSPDDTPVTVTTSTHNGFVAISISDSGLGIPEAERALRQIAAAVRDGTSGLPPKGG